MCVNQWLCTAVVSGQVPRRKHQYKDASEHMTQQSISTITQRGDERACASEKGKERNILLPAAESHEGKHGDLLPV